MLNPSQEVVETKILNETRTLASEKKSYSLTKLIGAMVVFSFVFDK